MYHLNKFCLSLTAKSCGAAVVLPHRIGFPAVAQNCSVFKRNVYQKPVPKIIPTFWPEETLVKLGESSSPRKIFFVHGIEGHVGNLKNFGELLSPTIQAYGLQLTPDIQTHCIEIIAGLYICSIIKEQPKGPYNIGCYSSGGPIALEIISQFEQKLDEKVNNWVLLDGFLQIELGKVDMVEKLKDFATTHLAEYEKTGDCIGMINRLSSLDKSKLHRENMEVFMGYFKRLLPNDIYGSVKKYFDRYLAVGFLSAVYQPAYEFNGNTLLITPKEKESIGIARDKAKLLLDKVCKVPPAVLEVDGNHQNFLENQAYLNSTAQMVNNFLQLHPDPIPEPEPEPEAEPEVKSEAKEEQATKTTS